MSRIMLLYFVLPLLGILVFAGGVSVWRGGVSPDAGSGRAAAGEPMAAAGSGLSAASEGVAAGEGRPAAGDSDDSDNTGWIATFVQREMKAGNIPGLALGIVRGDRVIYLEGFGTAGPGMGRVTPRTAFVIGSVSKSFTGLAVLQLAEKGLIRLDDPVRIYIPWFSATGPGASGSIKILHLLNHTSGISKYDGNDSGIERGSTLEERIRLKSPLKLKHEPGEAFEYSSLNYDILGELIQVVSGQAYGDYVKENIFGPLDMKNSDAALSKASGYGLAPGDGLAVGYRPWFGLQVPARVEYSASALPSGYIISTAEDMTHYLSAFINGGKYDGRAILSEDWAARTQASIGNTSYGAGWFSSGYYKWHTGELANYNAYICTVPSEKLGIVLLSNTNDIGVKFLNRGGSSLWRIPEGIRLGMVGGKLPGQVFPNTNNTYVLLDLLLVLLLAIAARLLLRAHKLSLTWLRPRRPFVTGRAALLKPGITALLALSIPTALFPAIPPWIGGSWHALLVSVPDLTLAAAALLTLLFIIGIRYTVIFFKLSKRRCNYEKV